MERKTQGESKHAIVPSVQRVLIVSQVPFTYTHIDVRTYKVCPEKVPAIVNIMRMVCTTVIHNLPAKESGWKCACVNNDDFTVLVSGGGRHP